MSIEIEYHTLTGMIGNAGATGILNLNAMPSTGPYGTYDIAVDPVDGPAQKYIQGNTSNSDFGITGQPSPATGGAIHFNLPNSSIKQNLLNLSDYGATGISLRVIYNHNF